MLTDGACINPTSKKAKRSDKGTQMIVNSKFIHMQIFFHQIKMPQPTKPALVLPLFHPTTFSAWKWPKCSEALVKGFPWCRVQRWSSFQSFYVDLSKCSQCFPSALHDACYFCLWNDCTNFAPELNFRHIYLHYIKKFGLITILIIFKDIYNVKKKKISINKRCSFELD